MKTCASCEQTKPLSSFGKKKDCAGGIKSRCKACVKLENALWYANNKSTRRQSARLWAKANPSNVALHASAWRTKNLSSVNKKMAEYQHSHRALFNGNCAKWRATLLRATPTWANAFFITEIYGLSEKRTKSLGIAHQVDHIVPLVSKRVCGLHVEANLQVITATHNRSKGNRTWPNM